MKFSVFSIVAGTSRCVTVCPFCVSGELATIQNREVPKINHRNLLKGCELAKTSGVQTVMLTSRGEPTLFPDQITEYLETLEPYKFPFIELQTNGIPMARKFEKYKPIEVEILGKAIVDNAIGNKREGVYHYSDFKIS